MDMTNAPRAHNPALPMSEKSESVIAPTEQQAPAGALGLGTGSASEVRCYKHYCRVCHAMHFVPDGDAATAEYPRCCAKSMAYLGIVDARPGRDETLMRGKPNAEVSHGGTPANKTLL